jgi:endonuclease/exonuclease/phosphatase (EEP) superfamily protein YafD
LPQAFVLNLDADRPAVIVKTTINNEPVVFVSIHLVAFGLRWVDPTDIPKAIVEKTKNQNTQVKILLAEFNNTSGSIIIDCDCNSKETSSSYRTLAKSYRNTARDVGWILFADRLPGAQQDTYFQHIYYVWYRGSLVPLGAYKIQDSAGSDHWPVMALFRIQPPDSP